MRSNHNIGNAAAAETAEFESTRTRRLRAEREARADLLAPGGQLTRGRKFGAEDLQLMLLAVVAEGPCHGYQLIKALQTRSNGYYSPSPGMVYPALTVLEQCGHARVEIQANRKCFHLAEPGQAYLQANRERVELLFSRLRHAARKMAWVRRALETDVDAMQKEVAEDEWLAEFVRARMALKAALLRCSDADHAEQRRVAAILAHATAEILKENASAAAGPERRHTEES